MARGDIHIIGGWGGALCGRGDIATTRRPCQECAWEQDRQRGHLPGRDSSQTRYVVRIDDYTVDPSRRGLDLLALMLRDALRANGITTKVDYDESDAERVFILGLLRGRTLPKNAVVFNAEQIGVSPYLSDVDMLRENTFWDFSASNINRLRARGLASVVHCPIGYSQCLEATANDSDSEDIDVLFYGHMNARRQAIVDVVKNAGVDVVVPPPTYGAELDRLVARSKIVLNIHFYPGSVHEIIRTSYLYANRKCVVTERSDEDDIAQECAATVVQPSRIAAACRYLLDNPDKRATAAQRAYKNFRKRSFAESVRKALTFTLTETSAQD